MDGEVLMSIKSDKWIKEKCDRDYKPMILPYVPELQSNGVISYGQSSYSYDIRVANEFRLIGYHESDNKIIDPKSFDSRGSFYAEVDNYMILEPYSFTLARSYEYIRMPDDCIAMVSGKSTYARCGLSLDNTVLQPGWEGHITLELTNSTSLPIKVYAMEGIAQLIFLQSDERCLETYADKGGKYNRQTGITLPKVRL